MFNYSKNIDRSSIFNRCGRDQIVENYKKNYGPDIPVGFDKIEYHAKLEGELTDIILNSDRESRPAIVAECYSKLYRELYWLAGTGSDSGAEQWLSLLFNGAQVYEVGSGAGYLSEYLNAHGVDCVRTDISNERTAVRRESGGNPIQSTDGVRLSEYLGGETFDFVISDQVVEHIHPEDLETHFREALKILVPGGSYIFRAPHALFGPHDLSKIFGEPTAVFMHLHEFCWKDVALIVQHCGYRRAKAIFRLPKLNFVFSSSLYFLYLLWMENKIEQHPNLKRFAKFFHFPSQVWVKLEA